MDEVDAGAVVVVLLGGTIAAIGALLALMGVLCMGGGGWAFTNLSGTAGSASTLGVLALLAAVGASPGLVLGSLGLVLVGAVGWGRLTSRWSRIRWEADRDGS